MDFTEKVNNILVYTRDLNLLRERMMTRHFFKPAGTKEYLPINPSLSQSKRPMAIADDAPSSVNQKRLGRVLPEESQIIVGIQTRLNFWKSQDALDFIL